VTQLRDHESSTAGDESAGADVGSGSAGTVLYLAPGGDGEGCRRMLETEPSANLLRVAYGNPDGRVAAAAVAVDARSARVVSVGGGTRGEGDGVEVVEAPTDLTGLGITVGKCLRATEDGPTHVCFDSLTATLEFAEEPTAFEFLHVLGGQLYEHGAVGHFHVNPAAHDDRTIERAKSLVDAMVREDGDDIEVLGGG
jgi:hypothetical protein